MSETGQAKRGQGVARAVGVIFGTIFAGVGMIAFVSVLKEAGKLSLIALFPLAFVLVGVVVIVASVRLTAGSEPGVGQRTAAEANRVAGLPAGADEREETRELKAEASPMARFFAYLLITLFWNGIVSIFLADVIRGWRAGQRPIGLSVFLLPFVAVGLAGVGMVVYSLLALFNPRPRLRLSPGTLTLGKRAQVEWEVGGAVHRLRKLTIVLEGREEATYRRGTDTHTDREVFARIPVAERGAGELRRGSARIDVPAQTMHSFEADNNKVVWALQVRGEIRAWPDVSEELRVVVLPAREPR